MLSHGQRKDGVIGLEDHDAYLYEVEVFEEEDSDKWGRKWKRTKLDSLAPYMQCNVVTGENFLFKDLWKYIEKDKDFYNIAFYVSLGFFDLANYIQDSNFEEQDSDDKNKPPIDYLLIRPFCEIDLFKHEDEPDGIHSDFSVVIDFYGAKKEKDDDGEVYDKAISLGLRHISELMDLPLMVSSDISVVHTAFDGLDMLSPNENDREDSDDITRNIIAEKASWGISVYEMLNSIFNEISFYGTPEDKSDFREELYSKFNEVKEAIKQQEDDEDNDPLSNLDSNPSLDDLFSSSGDDFIGEFDEDGNLLEDSQY